MVEDTYRNNEHYPDPTAHDAIKRVEYGRVNNVRRGEIYYIDGKQTDFSHSAGRAAIIVSNNAGNMYSNSVIVVYMTRKTKKPLPTHAIVQTGCPCTVQCEQIETVAKDRIGGYIGRLTQTEMRDVEEALIVAVGLHGHSEG